MRSIVNVSLPKETLALIKREVKRDGYASTSEFVRMLVREYQRGQLSRSLHTEREHFLKGTAKKLRSLKDLR